MGSKKAILVSVLAALVLTAPASASAAIEVSVSTTDVDMGVLPVNTSKTETVTVTSTGTDPVTMGEHDLTLPDGSYSLRPAFSVSQPDSCDELTPGEACGIAVTFTPRTASNYEMHLLLRGNFATIKVILRGSGVDPQAEVTPNLRFGERIIGRSSTRTASVTASTFTPINVDSTEISGPGASFYSVEYNADACNSVTFNSSCDFDVTYLPTTVGNHPAELKLTGNFGSEAIPLSGSARNLIPPKLALKISGPRKAAPGKTLTLKARIFNRGEIEAKRITLKALVDKKLVGKIKPIKIKSIPRGKSVTKTVKIKLKPGAKIGSRLKVRLAASAKSAKTGKSTRTIQVR